MFCPHTLPYLLPGYATEYIINIYVLRTRTQEFNSNKLSYDYEGNTVYNITLTYCICGLNFSPAVGNVKHDCVGNGRIDNIYLESVH